MIDLSKLKTAEQRAADAFDAEYSQQKTLRQIAYQKEADPIFFQYQRGTQTEAVWLAKVDEIKARYPYPKK